MALFAFREILKIEHEVSFFLSCWYYNGEDEHRTFEEIMLNQN